jgi:cytidylate kinase
MALEARDQSDRTRTNSPLVAAADAVRVDTTGVPAEQVVDRVLAVIRGRVEP